MNVTSSPIIHTPDQRLRVFVSSTLQELADERQAAREAIEQLRLTPVMFELGARPHPPRDLYRAYLDQSHIFIGIYWQKYGWVAPGEAVSGLEDEYQLAGPKPKLIYFRQPASDREARLNELIDRIKGDDTVSYKYFSTAQELSDLIKNDLAMVLTERFEEVQADAQADHPQANLPTPLNRLIGREKELAAVHDLLVRDDVNLVTLTGPGGTGKSLLGLYAARELRDRFKDGVYLVRLAPIHDSEHVSAAIAQTLNVRESPDRSALDVLIEYLNTKQLLLLIDNFEHVVDAAPILSKLLEGCPHVKVLVTSRILLRLRSEHELFVPPLELPTGSTSKTAQELLKYSALELFTQRVQCAKPDFKITNENANLVSEICRQLDGLPLAIELAAARMRILSPQMLLDRLKGHRFDTLIGGTRDLPARQQTLHNTIDWSYNLLDARAQRLFRRLAVFAGGCTLEATEAVCNADHALDQDILDELDTLADNSLITSSEIYGELRYGMLESIREYAFEKLKGDREDGECHRLHAEYFLQLAESAEPHFVTPDRPSWLSKLQPERDNLRVAVHWCAEEPDPVMAIRIVSALGWYWYFTGQISEGRANAEQAITRLDSGQSIGLRARLLFAAGGLASAQTDFQIARDRLIESAELCKQIGDRRRAGYALVFLALCIMSLGDPQKAEQTFSESVDLFKSAQDDWGHAYALTNMAEILIMTAEIQAAHRACEEGLVLWQKVGDAWGEANHLCTIASLEWYEGDDAVSCSHYQQSVDLLRAIFDRWGLARTLNRYGFALLFTDQVDQAETCFYESLDLWRSMGNERGVVHCLIGLAGIAAKRRRIERAAKLIGALNGLPSVAGYFAFGFDRARYERTIELTKAEFSEQEWKSWHNTGQLLSLDQAISYALSQEN